MNENLVALHPYICRYIDATELFDCIKNKRIILRDPKFWEDKNDYFLITIIIKFRCPKKQMPPHITSSSSRRSVVVMFVIKYNDNTRTK